jgi:hypothetical protein
MSSVASKTASVQVSATEGKEMFFYRFFNFHSESCKLLRNNVKENGLFPLRKGGMPSLLHLASSSGDVLIF